jgi:glucan phosphoethanolaminetransferase (alkaline phosphatase superfamily)
MEMDLELTNTETKLKKEMKHFMALVVMSIAFGGMAMAFAISSITTNAFALTTTISNIFLNILLIAISFIVAYLAIRYIISTVEVFDKFDEIQEDEVGEKNRTREKLTERIVKLMGLYRDEKPQIKRMILISKIAGVCFLANAFIQTATLIVSLTTGTAEVISAVVGILVSIVMSAVGFFLPSSFRKYAVCWDERLVRSIEAEKKIASFMEEP